MNVALVQDAENDIDRYERSQNEDGLVGQRLEKGGRGALEGGLNARGHVQFLLRGVDGVHGVAERPIGGQIERESNDGKLALMIERQSGVARIKARAGAERGLRAVGRVYINISQRMRILLELRMNFHNHVLLSELEKSRGALAPAKSIFDRVFAVGGMRSLTSEALIVRWASELRLTRMRPLFSVVFVPSTPINEERLSTASSLRIKSAIACWRRAIAAKETLCGPSETPRITPVS